MRNEIIASTSYGVEKVSMLDRKSLDDLAQWLCKEAGFCEEKYQKWKQKFSSADAQQKWEQEQNANGGYCDTCRDFAGLLLSQFNLRRTEDI